MVLIIIVLNKTDCLEDFLCNLAESGIRSATIFDSSGMAHTLSNETDFAFVSGLRHFLNPDREKSKTILIVTEKDKIPLISEILNKVTGGITQPDTGIMFCTEINYMEGLGPN